MKKFTFFFLFTLYFVFSFAQIVKINPHYLSLQAGTSYKLSLYSNQSLNQIKWTSNNPLVTVTKSGIVTALLDTLGNPARAQIIARDTITNVKDTCFVTIVSWVANVSRLYITDTLPYHVRILGKKNDSIVFLKNYTDLYIGTDIDDSYYITSFDKSITDSYPRFFSTPFGYFIRYDKKILKSTNLKTWSLVFETKSLETCHSIDTYFDSISNTGYVFASDYTPSTDSDSIRHCVYRGRYYPNNTSVWDTIFSFYCKNDFMANKETWPYVRHIHVVFMDPKTGSLWLSTGDEDNQSSIYYSDNFGDTFHLLGVGSQDWRSLSFFFTDKNIYWSMDSQQKQHIWQLPRSVFTLNNNSWPTITPTLKSGKQTKIGIKYYVLKQRNNAFFPVPSGNFYTENTIRNLNDSNYVIECNNPDNDYRRNAVSLINSALWSHAKIKSQSGRELFLMTSNSEGQFRDMNNRLFGFYEKNDSVLNIQEIITQVSDNPYTQLYPICQDKNKGIYLYQLCQGSGWPINVYKASIHWNDSITQNGEIIILDSLITANNKSYLLKLTDHGNKIVRWEYKNCSSQTWIPINDTAETIYSIAMNNQIYQYRVVMTDALGNSLYSSTILLPTDNNIVTPSDPGPINGITVVCQGQNNVVYSVPTINNATSYQWNLPTGTHGYSNTNTIAVSFDSSAVSGIISVKGLNACLTGNSSEKIISVKKLPKQPSSIENIQPICAGQVVSFSTPPMYNSTGFQWYLNNVATSNHTTTVNFNLSSIIGDTFYIKVQNLNTCGSSSTTQKKYIITHLPITPNFSNNSISICEGNKYKMPLPNLNIIDSLVWNLPQHINESTSNDSVLFGMDSMFTNGIVTVKNINQCGLSNSFNITVNKLYIPNSAGVITGFDTVCAGQNSVVYSTPVIPNATAYNWSFPQGVNANITLNTAIANYTTNSSSGNIVISGQNICGNGQSSTKVVFVNHKPTFTNTSIPPLTLCSNQSNIPVMIPQANNATSYLWNLSHGLQGSTVANTIYLNVNDSITSGIIKVKSQNNCGIGDSLSVNLLINKPPLQPDTIYGPQQVCRGENNLSYFVPLANNATSYLWKIPATYSGNTTSNNIHINISQNAISDTIKVKSVNSCGESPLTNLTIAVKSTPLTPLQLNAPDTICANENFVLSVPFDSMASEYKWNLPNGIYSSFQNYLSSSIAGNTSNYTISVKLSNYCGESPEITKNIYVRNLPQLIPPIIGQISICPWEQNLSYSISGDSNAFEYQWILPNGLYGNSNDTMILIQNDSNIFNSGVITVSAANQCGSSNHISLYIAANPLPQMTGSISGPSVACQNDQNISYFIPPILNASLYHWLAPNGITIASVQNNTIYLNANNASSSGFLTVTGENNCGISTTDSLYIQVFSIPLTPIISQSGNHLLSNAQDGNQWYETNSGLITDATDTVFYPSQNGNYFVTVYQNGCLSNSSDTIYYDFVKNDEIFKDNTKAEIFPNPVTNTGHLQFFLTMTQSISYQIFDVLGNLVFNSTEVQKSKGNNIENFDVGHFGKGIYFLNLKIGKDHTILKFAVQ
ncbi:MAG: T9SS type A sorting domain-containing protein [Bacteroidetes bacterium]|nr:T9SS type A sorting domain-containing protein [Bacteroidota bacterium]